MSEREEQERSADVIDQAGQTEALFRDASLSSMRGKLAPETHPDFDGTHCVEEFCGEEIPAARLAMKKVRCVDCQTAKEKLEARRL